MKRWWTALAVVAAAVGCNPAPRPVSCLTYVAGGFNRENRYSFSVDAKTWPRLDENGRIELTFLLASGKPQPIDLVHVLGDREIERWTLQVTTDNIRFPTCLITGDPKTSNCGATVRVLPHDPGGYWYVQANDDLLEAGMSFVLCRAPVAAAAAPAPAVPKAAR